MGNLYKNLAKVYEAMYQTFINYPEEYAFYSGLLVKYEKREVLEIGSGTGHLAQYFLDDNFQYQGLDYSAEMIEIANQKVPTGQFLQGDMRNFKLKKSVESVIITGRTISYLLKNEDINDTLSVIYKNLKPKGILCFDFIDANQFIPTIAKGKNITHQASFKNKHYSRDSYWSLDLNDGLNVKWDATYFEGVGAQRKEIGTDNSTIRTFTINELEVYLEINQFRVKEIIEKSSYAFPTYVIVAERKGTL